jgi:hypothetical protein
MVRLLWSLLGVSFLFRASIAQSSSDQDTDSNSSVCTPATGLYAIYTSDSSTYLIQDAPRTGQAVASCPAEATSTVLEISTVWQTNDVSTVYRSSTYYVWWQQPDRAIHRVPTSVMPIRSQYPYHRYITLVRQPAMPNLSFAIRRRSIFMAAIKSVALTRLFDYRQHIRCRYFDHVRLARELDHLRDCQLSDHLQQVA